MKNSDITISGGGLVGLSFALLLGQLGYKILVLEKNEFDLSPKHDLRSIVLSYTSSQIFTALKLWPKMKDLCSPIHKIHVSEKSRFGVTELCAKEHDMPALGYVINYTDLCKILYEAICQSDNIQLLTSTSAQELQKLETGWSFHIENELYQTKLLVAAEGMHSIVRQMVNIAASQKDYEQIALVSHVTLNRSHDQIAYERFTQQGIIALLPYTDKQCALIWTLAKEYQAEILALSDADFLKKVQTLFGYRLGKMTHIGKKTVFPLQLVLAQEQVSAHTLLLGNAARTLHPIAAQGFNLALRDCAVFVEMLVDSKAQINDLNFLQAYARARQKDQDRVVRFTDGLVGLFTSDSLVLSKLRNLALLGVSLSPSLKTWIGKYGAGRLGKIPRLARGLEL